LIQSNYQLHDKELTSDSPNNNGQDFLHQVKWLSVYMIIGLVIIWLFTFPIDFALLILILASINIWRRRVLLKKLHLDKPRVLGWRRLFKSLFQSPASSSAYDSSRDNNLVKYYCMLCGNQNNEIACPRCGSKMKRAN
jgi:hypothetical protein